MKTTITALACAGALTVATPATAQDSNSDATSDALILVPLELTKVDDLDFGTIVSSPNPGTVVIPADGSARTATGGVVPHPGDAGNVAEFYTAATAGQEVLFVLTSPATLDDGLGHSIPVLSLTLDGSNFRYADSFGVVRVRVGGILWIDGDQEPGTYSNTFNLYAEYR